MYLEKSTILRLFFGLIFVLASLGILFYSLNLTLVNIAKIIALMLPLILIFALKIYPLTPILTFAFIASEELVLPVYGLKKLTPCFILLSAASVITLLNTAKHKLANIKSLDAIDRWVLFLTFIVTLRLIYDRPGFVGLGASSGGFIASLQYVSCFFFYFVIRITVNTFTFKRKHLYWVLLVACISLFWEVFGGKSVEGQYIGRSFMNAPSWLIVASLVTIYATESRNNKTKIKYYISILASLAAGIFSGFRSRIFFFIAEVLVIAKLTKSFRLTCNLLLAAGFFGIIVLLSLPEIPVGAKRVLSLIIEVDAEGQKMGGALGWEDSFRGELYGYAWNTILEHPFIGSGFGLDVKEAISILSARAGGTYAEFLALSGSYHNSIIAFAVKLGIPCALIFIIISIIIPYRFYKLISKARSSDLRSCSIAIFAFWVANTGMLLMNGGPHQFFICMLLNGLMSSISTLKLDELKHSE